MSGPFDRADDPDEVTLWSGRLRPWPAAPVSDVDDETARTGETDLDDDTVVSRHHPDDVTVRSARHEIDDDTVVSRSASDAPHPAPWHPAPAPFEPMDAADAADELTTTAPRRRPVPAPDVDEVTRRRPAPTPEVDDVTRRRPAPAPEVDDTTAPGTRARSVVAPAHPAPNHRAPAQEVPGTVRAAHVPIAGEQQAYAPRTDEPVRAERRVVASEVRVPTGAPVGRRRTARRGAVRALVLAGVIVVLLGVAVAAAVLLLG